MVYIGSLIGIVIFFSIVVVLLLCITAVACWKYQQIRRGEAVPNRIEAEAHDRDEAAPLLDNQPVHYDAHRGQVEGMLNDHPANWYCCVNQCEFVVYHYYM